MTLHILKRTLHIKQPIRTVFSFFQEPENLARITPPGLKFRLLTPPPIAMKEGAVIDYVVSPLFFPIRWTTLISVYDPPHKFVDLQLRGPYSLWHHTHSFREIDGGTEMTDEVRYLMPFWILGDIFHTLVISRQLEKIFDHRARVIAKFLSASGADEGSP